MNEMQECGKEDPPPQEVNEVPLTNGHTHLVNGALKPEGLSPVTDKPSIDKELPKCRVRNSEDKPQSPPIQFQTKPDPYEFPHSPPKQSDQSSFFLEQSSSHGATEQRPKPPPPSYQEAIKATENHLLSKQLQPSCQMDSNSKKTPLSPASHSLSRSPVRLNGSHHNAFSSDSLNTTNITARPDPPSEKSSSSSKSSVQLLAQTGDLISEYYSHSRLHQISTWRAGFSEYVNELHSKRKAAGSTSFPGKERLRKSVAQHSAGSRGKKGRVTLMLFSSNIQFISLFKMGYIWVSQWLSAPLSCNFSC